MQDAVRYEHKPQRYPPLLEIDPWGDPDSRLQWVERKANNPNSKIFHKEAHWEATQMRWMIIFVILRSIGNGINIQFNIIEQFRR